MTRRGIAWQDKEKRRRVIQGWKRKGEARLGWPEKRSWTEKQFGIGRGMEGEMMCGSRVGRLDRVRKDVAGLSRRDRAGKG